MLGDTPPRVPLWIFRAAAYGIGLKTKSYPEYYIKKLAALIGRKTMRGLPAAQRNWQPYERFRTPASISSAAAVWLWKTLAERQPVRMVEFGPGFSTFVLAAYARKQAPGRRTPASIVSLEHDVHWYAAQRRALEDARLQEYVQLYHAPLLKWPGGSGDTAQYDLAGLEGPVGSPDLIMVDGPPGSRYGGPGRAGSLMQAIDLAKPGALILLHDALREEEFHIICRVPEAAGKRIKRLGIVPDSQGLAVFEKCRD